jgi:hypothetical protein
MPVQEPSHLEDRPEVLIFAEGTRKISGSIYHLALYIPE